MIEVRIHLFGKFQVTLDERPISAIESSKARELFCYLLIHRDRPHSREALADLLWGESRVDRPNRSLRKALWKLRSCLDASYPSLSEELLLVDPEWIQLNPDTRPWLDIDAFEQAFERAKNLPGDDLSPQDLPLFQSAVDLYRGGLQESWYDEWYLFERERYQQAYLVLLDLLMAYCEAHEQYAAGITYGNRILGCVRARERTHRRLMRLHYLAGDRTAAITQFERCTQVLQGELGVEPAQSTVRLYRQIRGVPRNKDKAVSPAFNSVHTKRGANLSELLLQLKQMQDALAEMQTKVGEEIVTIETMMENRC